MLFLTQHGTFLALSPLRLLGHFSTLLPCFLTPTSSLFDSGPEIGKARLKRLIYYEETILVQDPTYVCGRCCVETFPLEASSILQNRA